MLSFPRWKVILVILVCVWGIYQAFPNFIPEEKRQELSEKYALFPSASMKLGLDLQGGSQLLLKIDFSHYLRGELEGIQDGIRRTFREAGLGYKSLSISETQDAKNPLQINFTLINTEKLDEAKDALNSVSSDIDYNIGDYGVTEVFFRKEVVERMRKSVQTKSIEIVRKRVDETGTREPIIQMKGSENILLQVPGLKNPEELKSLLGKTAKMTFHLMDELDPYVQNPQTRPRVSQMLLSDVDPKSPMKYLVNRRVEIGGEDLIDSQPTFDQSQAVVNFRFNGIGAKKFAKVTTENVGKPFAIVLDGKVITAPRINGAILGGSGIITGNFTTESATELSILLRSGALPTPLEVVEERSVGPSLGKDSIDAGIKASYIGSLFVVLIMVGVYRLFGFFSVVALAVNMILVFAILSLFDATLTMPGIAGLVLTLGMSVDANVLIFERIKEEIKLGKTPFAALDAGFKNAYSAIMDSNISTLIATFILFSYGTGPIKGFAVTLSAGVITSMFTATMLTRMMIVSWVRRSKVKTLKL